MFYHTQEETCSLPWQAEALSDLCLAGSLTEKFSAKRRKLLRMFSSRYTFLSDFDSSKAIKGIYFPFVDDDENVPLLMMMMKTSLDSIFLIIVN